jgi:2-polyprenyl-6-methoxyphenol hydroxylase-like FAD-dependent oxidoreductase
MSKNNEPIIIVGAGVGGLTLALALRKLGKNVRVLEQADKIQPIGYGIQLGPNAVRAFGSLGLAEQLSARSTIIDRINIRDAVDDSEVLAIETGARVRQRFGNPYTVVHRAHLHELLLEACSRGGVAISTGSAFLSVDADDFGVVAKTKDGETVEGAALVGADGLHSSVRANLFPERRALPSGYAAYRTLLDLHDPTIPPELKFAEVTLWAGPAFHVICYPLGENILNLVVVVRLDEAGDPDSLTNPEIARARGIAHPTARWLLERVSIERRWAICDIEPMRKWGRGRVILIGDAAHATLQTLAQGAGMAVEDSVSLASQIGQADGNIVQAFDAFNAERVVRTARVQLESRALWEVIHCEGIQAEVRGHQFRDYEGGQALECLAWLWGYSGQEKATRRFVDDPAVRRSGSRQIGVAGA